MSGGETRTISLYHVHTGESLTVTYMIDGKYVPSAMKQINHLLRDWRKNQTITIDPRTIDLVWELHADLGSKAPIHIVCGYRSAATNSFLHRIGRNVARKSQHILGKAMDIYFPDVSTLKMRNSALVRQVGGVGYYRSAGGPSGFLHVDSGHVRHWGPGISAREMAQIFRDYRRTVGARLSHGDQIMLASAKEGFSSPSQSDSPVDDSADDTSADTGAMAQLSESASQAPVIPKAKPLQESAEAQTADASASAAPVDLVPKPRPKPIEVLMMAAVNMKIEPASAPPETAAEDSQSPVADNQGTVVAAASMAEETPLTALLSNGKSKGGLAKSLVNGTAAGVPTIKTITASAAGQDLFWWPSQLTFDGAQAIRRDGAPQPFVDEAAGILPGSAEAAEAPALPKLALASMQQVATGKGDMLVVNRNGKGNLETNAVIRIKPQTVGLLEPQ